MFNFIKLILIQFKTKLTIFWFNFITHQPFNQNFFFTARKILRSIPAFTFLQRQSESASSKRDGVVLRFLQSLSLFIGWHFIYLYRHVLNLIPAVPAGEPSRVIVDTGFQRCKTFLRASARASTNCDFYSPIRFSVPSRPYLPIIRWERRSRARCYCNRPCRWKHFIKLSYVIGRSPITLYRARFYKSKHVAFKTDCLREINIATRAFFLEHTNR